MDKPEPLPPVRCIFLRCKSMLVYGEAFEEDPEYQSGCIDWWCNQTAQGAGPDGGEVSLTACMSRERPCHRAY